MKTLKLHFNSVNSALERSNTCDSIPSDVFKTGGLFHFQPQTSNGALSFALSLITTQGQKAPPSPHSSHGHTLWISDEGSLNPAVLAARRIEVSRLILMTPPNAKESWECALLAAQTGLFDWILLRPSQPTSSASTARRLQLAAEKTVTRILILAEAVLPHWVLRARFCL